MTVAIAGHGPFAPRASTTAQELRNTYFYYMEQNHIKTGNTALANGIRMAYTDSGKGKHTLLFIHGFPFSKKTWEPQSAALSKNHRVITYDIRGFGQSEFGNEKAGIDLYANDLLLLIDALGLEKVTACGLSMGGYILMNAVARAPEKFEALILADTQCIADSEEGREKRFKTIEKIEKEGLEKFAEGFVQNVFCKKSLETKQSVVKGIQDLIVSTSQHTVTATLKALAERKETCNLMKQSTLPTLIICGEEDTVTPLSQSKLLNNTISGSELKVIPDAGHMSNLEQPEEFNKAVTGFLDKL